MKTRTLCYIVWGLAWIAYGCTPSPVPPPLPDASDASLPPAPKLDGAPGPSMDASPAPPPDPLCMTACAALGAAGCPEADAGDCSSVLHQVELDRLVRSPSGAPLSCACLAGAHSGADARLCGVPCAGVR